MRCSIDASMMRARMISTRKIGEVPVRDLTSEATVQLSTISHRRFRTDFSSVEGHTTMVRIIVRSYDGINCSVTKEPTLSVEINSDMICCAES
jgi:hypothetical protein